MPWSTGTVSTFTNKKITATEVIGAADGAQTVFSNTLSKPPIFIDSVWVQYVISSTPYQVQSDANGNFSGTGISSGSVNEAGAISITFSTPPDNLTNVFVYEYKTKGLLQKLIEFITTNQYEETLGVGDGVETSFSTTLSNTTIAKGQTLVKFKIAGAIYWVWDNGNGEFEHNLISSSSLNYGTGAISITFTDPVDAYTLTVTYTTGAEGRDWLLLHEDLAQDNVLADAYPTLLLKQYVLKNSGSNWAENILVGLRETQYIPENQYQIELNLYKQFAEVEQLSGNWNINAFKTTYDATREHWTGHPSSAFNDAPMSYWIKSTKDYVFFEAKVSGTVYTGFYFGTGIRFASIADYKNPTIILANQSGNYAFSSTAAAHSMCILPVASNSAWSINKEDQLMDWSDFRIVPTNDYVDTGDLEKTTNTKVALNELFVVKFDPTPSELLFQIRDLFFTPYVNMSAEDSLTEGANTYTVFQNIFRAATKDYFAIKQND